MSTSSSTAATIAILAGTTSLVSSSSSSTIDNNNGIVTTTTTTNVHQVNKNRNILTVGDDDECNTFDKAILSNVGITTPLQEKKTDEVHHDEVADVGILLEVVGCNDIENETCVPDESSSLGGRCTTTTVTDTNTHRHGRVVDSNGYNDVSTTDTLSSSTIEFGRDIQSSSSSSSTNSDFKPKTTRFLQSSSYTFNCPTTCSQSFCNCIQSTFDGVDSFLDDKQSQCASEIAQVCTTTESLLACGITEDTNYYIGFITEGVCPYAECLVKVQEGDMMEEECFCEYYSNYCELYQEYCYVSECCDDAPLGEKAACLPRTTDAPTSSPIEQVVDATSTSSPIAIVDDTPTSSPTDVDAPTTATCGGEFTFLDLQTPIINSGDQSLLITYQIGDSTITTPIDNESASKCDYELDLYPSPDCGESSEISGVTISRLGDRTEIDNFGTSKIIFEYRFSMENIEQSNIWNEDTQRVEVCIVFKLLNENGETVSQEKRLVGLAYEEVVANEGNVTTAEEEEVTNVTGGNVTAAEEEEVVVKTTYSPTLQVTRAPTTVSPTTVSPMSIAPTSASPTTTAPVSAAPTMTAPVSSAPVTSAPVAQTLSPMTMAPTTSSMTTGGSSLESIKTNSPTVVSGDITAYSVTNEPTIPISLIPVKGDTTMPPTNPPVSSGINPIFGKSGKSVKDYDDTSTTNSKAAKVLFTKSSKALSYGYEIASRPSSKAGKGTKSAKGGKASSVLALNALERVYDNSNSAYSVSASCGMMWGIGLATLALAWVNGSL